MDLPIATITSISDGMATVTVSRSIACARCAAGKGCGAGLLSGEKTPARLKVPISETMALHVGDQVKIELSPRNLLRASFLVYGLPLIGVVLALTVGWLIAAPLTDGTAIVLAAAGLLAGLAGGRMQLSRSRCLEQFVPRIANKPSLPAA